MKKSYYTNFDVVELENNEVFMRLGSKWYNMSCSYEAHARAKLPAAVKDYKGCLHNKGDLLLAAFAAEKTIRTGQQEFPF